mmetsp:Transcript_21897/g.30492  ORF Transcript_21897/g.30492 Transcript_21897/m.30492 type:complete len:143 (-) Transcript_21897:222-650(-)
MKGFSMTRLFAMCALFVGAVSAFVPPQSATRSSFGVSHTTPFEPRPFYQPAALTNQRKSVAQVQTMSLFGLGAPELAIIAIAAAFLLGPQKLAELGKDAGKIAGELKEVPKEFQKGLEEGEQQAKEIQNEMAGTDVKVEKKE